MTLQTNGLISMEDVRTEFELSGTVGMDSFYGKGGAQTEGMIALQDFYGRSNYQTM